MWKCNCLILFVYWPLLYHEKNYDLVEITYGADWADLKAFGDRTLKAGGPDLTTAPGFTGNRTPTFWGDRAITFWGGIDAYLI